MKRIIFVFILSAMVLGSQAQQKKIDSLKKLIAAAKDDTSRVILMKDLDHLFFLSKPDSAMATANEMLRISRSARFTRGELLALNDHGIVYRNMGNYPKALSYYLAAQKLAEQMGDKMMQSKTGANIGTIFTTNGDPKRGISYFFRSLVIAKRLNEKPLIQALTVNIGDGYEKLNMLDSALFYTRQALPLALNLTDPDAVGIVYNNFGNIYSKMHMRDSAMFYYRKSLVIYRQASDDDGICESALGMARIFRQLGQLDSSLYYGRQSIAAGWRGGFTERVLNASQFLTAYFKQQGKTDSAYRYLEVSVAAKDSLFSQEKNKELQNLSFAERQRQQEIQEKEVAYKTSVRYYMLLAVIVFLVVMALVFWRNNKLNQKANKQLQSQNIEIEKQKKSVEAALGELKTTQAQLVQSAKMASLGELTAGIAHEIQNPLNFVNNFSEVNTEMFDELEEELKQGNITEAMQLAADMKQNEAKIRHHGKRADFIVKGMLEHSRTSSGERQETNINVLAEEFLKLSYHGLRAKDKSFNAELVTNFDDKLPRIRVIQQDLGRVLINLFGNAFYAVNQKAKTAGSNYKPTVEVKSSRQNGSVVISVKDNGVGIPEDIREKIMQPFFTTKPTGEGTGLGLSLSYDIIVKGHGGKIDVESKEGKGSEFIIQLPV